MYGHFLRNMQYKLGEFIGQSSSPREFVLHFTPVALFRNKGDIKRLGTKIEVKFGTVVTDVNIGKNELSLSKFSAE